MGIAQTFLNQAPAISFGHNPSVNKNALFSIVIPTWNNLAFLKTCIESLQKNSRYPHQIIIHLNEGSDGTLAWVKEQLLDYSYSDINIGICYAMNIARTLAKTDYLVYFNDDMYACPDWDYWLYEEIKKQPSIYFYLSATMIEPRNTGNPCVISPVDYGTHPENFNEQGLLADFKGFEKDDWQGSTWPPCVVPVLLWDMVGGYSIEFSPGMYSDPDFAMKLWLVGVRMFKGVGNSRVYHFMSKSTGKLTVKVNGPNIFLQKWGITSSVFSRFYLRRGKAWLSALPMPDKSLAFKVKVFLSDIKRRIFPV